MKLIRFVALVIAALALRPASVLGEDLPPGPATIHPLGRMPVEQGAARFEETQSLILDFAPGAWTPLHSHGGPTLVRVLEGEMTRRATGTEDLFRAGEGWVKAPSDSHAAGNAGSTPARVLVTFLLPAVSADARIRANISRATAALIGPGHSFSLIEKPTSRQLRVRRATGSAPPLRRVNPRPLHTLSSRPTSAGQTTVRKV